MPERTAICNTGPLIALAKVQRLDLLTSLFARIRIPDAVATELIQAGIHLPGASVIGKPGFEVAAPEKEIDPLLEAELDKGEAAVIQLALETNNSEVLIDEKRARRIAVSVYGLNVLGIGGLLLRAKRSGLISEVKPFFEQIRANGYFISNRLMEGILGAAGEC